MTPEVSVVVPTYRRPELLKRCLQALLMQDLVPEQFEIVVCDDGPDDSTWRLVDNFREMRQATGLDIRYLPVSETQGPAAARNLGWRSARAEVVAFTDDDTIPCRHWLRCGLAAIRKHGAAAVAGRIVVPLSEAPTDYERDAAGLARAEFATANCFVLRSVLETVGGFDERYTAAWREDSDLQFSILAADGIVATAPAALVLHPVRPAHWGVSVSQAKKSQFDALLFKKYRAQYRTRIARPPWNYYAIALSAALALGALCFGAISAAVAAFAIWSALTARFAARRLRNTSRAPLHIAEMIWTSILIPPVAIAWRLYGALKFRVYFL